MTTTLKLCWIRALYILEHHPHHNSVWDTECHSFHPTSVLLTKHMIITLNFNLINSVPPACSTASLPAWLCTANALITVSKASVSSGETLWLPMTKHNYTAHMSTELHFYSLNVKHWKSQDITYLTLLIQLLHYHHHHRITWQTYRKPNQCGQSY